MKTLVLGLGNDLLGDDAVGIEAARRLRREVGESADVVESSQHGLALIDCMLGYNRMIILDAITTGKHPPGTVLSIEPDELTSVPGPSPHYSGLPEITALAGQLRLGFPSDIRIIAVEILDRTQIGHSLSPAVATALPELIDKVKAILQGWQGHQTRPGKAPRSHEPTVKRRGSVTK